MCFYAIFLLFGLIYLCYNPCLRSTNTSLPLPNRIEQGNQRNKRNRNISKHPKAHMILTPTYIIHILLNHQAIISVHEKFNKRAQ